jgi:hypothetical protein
MSSGNDSTVTIMWIDVPDNKVSDKKITLEK